MRHRYLFLLFCFLAKFSFGQSETMLTGKILDSNGKNLSGCEIRVCDCNKLDSTDNEGVYRIYLVPGNYELQVFRAGAMLRRRFVEIPPEDFFEVDFRL